jgi:hypothetical protein
MDFRRWLVRPWIVPARAERSPPRERKEGGRFELPAVVQRKAGRDIARILQSHRAGVQPRHHIGSGAPGFQRSEPNPPDQRPIRVDYEGPADAVHRRGEIPIEVVEIEREFLRRQYCHLVRCCWKGRADHHHHQARQLRRSGGRSIADESWSAISARRFTAFSRRAAASRAIAGSPLSPARGRLRSNAVMSSRSLRARSLRLIIAT